MKEAKRIAESNVIQAKAELKEQRDVYELLGAEGIIIFKNTETEQNKITDIKKLHNKTKLAVSGVAEASDNLNSTMSKLQIDTSTHEMYAS